MKSIAKLIEINKLIPNEGQIDGLPSNPRFIRDEKFAKLVQSIKDFPEMLSLRECIVIPFNQAFVVIAGNMRLKACEEVGIKEVPCKVLPKNIPADRLREITIKDNIGYGQDDWDALKIDWDHSELDAWGMDLPAWDDSEEEDDEPVPVAGDKKLVIEFTDDAQFETVKAEVEAVLEMYPGASLKP